MMPRPLYALALTLALGACGSDKAPATAESAGAQGEIQGGTISDEMLPLDELRSQSPPVKPSTEEVGAGRPVGEDQTDSEAAEQEASGEEPESEEADEPAAEPAEEG